MYACYDLRISTKYQPAWTAATSLGQTNTGQQRCTGKTGKFTENDLISWELGLINSKYTVQVHKIAPPPKLFAIFSFRLSIFVKFCQFVASLYPQIIINVGQFILTCNKMVLILLGVVIVFTTSSFKFQQFRVL